MKTSRKKWRKNWLDSINELTDLKLQQKSWLNPKNTNPHWGFIEFMCAYFDDVLIDYKYNHFIEIQWVDKKEFDIIQNWHELLDSYIPPKNNSNDLLAIINDSKWIRIVEEGHQSKVRLAKLLTDEEKVS